jgi:hypothetical protein
MWPASCQPTTLRLKASSTKAKNTSPSQQRSHEMSATQSSFGRGREVALDQVRPRLGVRVGLCGPPRPAAALGALDPVLAHQPLHPPRPTVSPALSSAFHIRR